MERKLKWKRSILIYKYKTNKEIHKGEKVMRNKKQMGIVGLAAIMVIGGTFAYFNQEMKVENPFDTGKYNSVLVEDFKPDDGENWSPGAEVNKDVQVKNTGDYDVLVRVKFDEKWVNKENNQWVVTNTGRDGSTGQEDESDGNIKNDTSVVQLNLSNSDKWVYADGYWYYKEILSSGENTGKFLDSVTLLKNTDMGYYTKKNYYSSEETRPDEADLTQWTEYVDKLPDNAKHNMSVTELDSAKPGYSNADYTLSITAQTVQVTKEAVQSAFGITEAPAGCTWGSLFN